jgi:hypothetical protein
MGTTGEVICKRCGLVDDYRTEVAGPHIKAICNGCGRYIKFLSQGKQLTALPFGKYKGREIESMTQQQEVQYLYWILANVAKLNQSLKDTITNHLKNYPQ